jgi:hypothetical protein
MRRTTNAITNMRSRISPKETFGGNRLYGRSAAMITTSIKPITAIRAALPRPCRTRSFCEQNGQVMPVFFSRRPSSSFAAARHSGRSDTVAPHIGQRGSLKMGISDSETVGPNGLSRGSQQRGSPLSVLRCHYGCVPFGSWTGHFSLETKCAVRAAGAGITSWQCIAKVRSTRSGCCSLSADEGSITPARLVQSAGTKPEAPRRRRSSICTWTGHDLVLSVHHDQLDRIRRGSSSHHL